MDSNPVISAMGISYWYLDDKLHREDGPAVEHPNGTRYWYLNDKIHREDGPAVERANGILEYWLNGKDFGYEKPYDWDDLVQLAKVEMIMES